MDYNELLKKVRKEITTDAIKTMDALLIVYNNQTEEEKTEKKTLKLNYKGLCKYDVEFMSSVSEWILEKGYLTGKQISLIQKMIGKYANQVLKYQISMGRFRKGMYDEWYETDKKNYGK